MHRAIFILLRHAAMANSLLPWWKQINIPLKRRFAGNSKEDTFHKLWCIRAWFESSVACAAVGIAGG
jgi:hypothetical protein